MYPLSRPNRTVGGVYRIADAGGGLLTLGGPPSGGMFSPTFAFCMACCTLSVSVGHGYDTVKLNPVQNETPTKKKSNDRRNDDLRPEYNLGKLLRTGVRDKCAERFREGTNLVLLAPDVADAFPTAESANKALRLVLQLTEVRSKKRKSSRQR